MYTTFVLLNKRMRLSIIIVVLENNLLHIQFETIMSRKFQNSNNIFTSLKLSGEEWLKE